MSVSCNRALQCLAASKRCATRPTSRAEHVRKEHSQCSRLCRMSPDTSFFQPVSETATIPVRPERSPPTRWLRQALLLVRGALHQLWLIRPLCVVFPFRQITDYPSKTDFLRSQAWWVHVDRFGKWHTSVASKKKIKNKATWGFVNTAPPLQMNVCSYLGLQVMFVLSFSTKSTQGAWTWAKTCCFLFSIHKFFPNPDGRTFIIENLQRTWTILAKINNFQN